MEQRQTTALLDGDFRRRAAVSHLLADTELHVEPFENLVEMASRWPSSKLVLACDEGSQIRDLLAHMSETGQWLPLVAYAPEPSIPRVVQAVLAGAVDYLDWPFGIEGVQAAMATADANEGIAGNARRREVMARNRIQKLTRREREVLAGVADGLSSRLIGDRLAISPRTVEIHRGHMLNKLGVSHTSEAIRIAVEASITSPNLATAA